MHFVQSREPVIVMKTKKANFCTQATTLAQSYTSPSSSKQFQNTVARKPVPVPKYSA